MNKDTKKSNKHTEQSVPRASRKSNKHPVGTDSRSLSAAVIGTDREIDSLTETEMNSLITLAKLQYASIKTTVVNEKRREVETLDNLIKEFMGPFILIGYDLNNNAIEMVSASSPAEHDALLERLRRLMFRINQNIANSNGADPYGQHSN